MNFEERKLVSRRFAVSKRKNNKRIGDSFEAQALHELQLLGWTILDAQYYTPYGEIDIVAIRADCLWFVEVKGSTGGTISWERVSKAKQKRMRQSIEHWLMEHDCIYVEMEAVVCFRTDDGLDWVRNAFDG